VSPGSSRATARAGTTSRAGRDPANGSTPTAIGTPPGLAARRRVSTSRTADAQRATWSGPASASIRSATPPVATPRPERSMKKESDPRAAASRS
jgi:hypothetical protein